MPSLLVPESIALESRFSPLENDRAGGGGPQPPVDGPPDVSELDPERSSARAGAYRLFTHFAMFWIVALFATIALVLESRWVHSQDWFSIPLPPVLYANTLILLAGSASVEFARRSLRVVDTKRSARWMFVTASLGAAFLAGQIVGWQEFGPTGPHAASNPGIFFYYLITGAHCILVLTAIAFLGNAGVSIRRPGQIAARQSLLGTLALYWHFLAGLWICLLGLLLTAIQ
jgi:cytochrome c oxidase subunit III